MLHRPSNASVSLASSRKSRNLNGILQPPGDKSMSHRAVMFGALAMGQTRITGLLEGEDVMATAAAMRAMGAQILRDADGWQVTGVGLGGLSEPETVLELGNSGTSARLLAGMIAGHPIAAVMTGDASLRRRPMARVIEPLRQMGAQFHGRSGGLLPMTVQGAGAIGSVLSRPLALEYRLPVASAQVKSAILLCGLMAAGDTVVIESHPTRDYTETMLRAFGADITTETLPDGAQAARLRGQPLLRGVDMAVPADPSSAAFPAVAACLCPDSEIVLKNVGMNPRRFGLYETLIEMGADIGFENIRSIGGEKAGDIRVRFSELRGIDVPAERAPSMIDEYPVLFVAASCAEGATRFEGLGELRVKESDRLLSMATGLAACGVRLEMGEDWLVIYGTGKPPKGGAVIATHLDHRIAMSFLVLGLVSDDDITIDDDAAIATSYPQFFDQMTAIGSLFTSCNRDYFER